MAKKPWYRKKKTVDGIFDAAYWFLLLGLILILVLTFVKADSIDNEELSNEKTKFSTTNNVVFHVPNHEPVEITLVFAAEESK
ncbi:hypothetical protein GOV04_05005 [Candidatus Woesearchaeota archaeon]|nr:hypothetical protein [Candidatus Woesearchaeota archaeon]